MPERGPAYLLWEDEQDIQRAIDDATDEIERLEAKIVAARAKRDEYRLLVVEVRAARQLIESSGLKVERNGTGVTVSIDQPEAVTT